jgi:hypothetical protein
MIVDKRPKKSKIEIDLQGPEGNAFMLLAVAKDLAHQLDMDWSMIHNEMTSSNYEWLLQVMDYHFGDFIIMYR